MPEQLATAFDRMPQNAPAFPQNVPGLPNPTIPDPNQNVVTQNNNLDLDISVTTQNEQEIAEVVQNVVRREFSRLIGLNRGV